MSRRFLRKAIRKQTDTNGNWRYRFARLQEERREEARRAHAEYLRCHQPEELLPSPVRFEPIKMTERDVAFQEYMQIVEEDYRKAMHSLMLPQSAIEGFGYSDMERTANAIAVFLEARRYNQEQFYLIRPHDPFEEYRCKALVPYDPAFAEWQQARAERCA